MKDYRIFYTITGATFKKTPFAIVKAATIDDACEAFQASHPMACIVAAFKA